jgi:hypothetical protein
MAASVLVGAVVVPRDGSDAVLVETVASLLAAMPGEFVRPRLSCLVEMVRSAHGVSGDRGELLMVGLAAYLQERHALPSALATVAGVDEWASHARIDVVRCALLAYARRLRSAGGGSR